MKKVLLGLSLLSSALFAQELTRTELVKLSIVNSPDINITTNAYKAAESRTDAATADYLPQVNIGATVGTQGFAFADNTMGLGSDSGALANANINASQLIYDFGKTGGNIDSFSYEANASNQQLSQSISDKILEVEEAYYQVLQANTLIKVNEENVKLNESQVIRSQRYFTAGIRTKIDVTDAEVKLIQAQLDLQNAHYDSRLALVNLQLIVGLMTANHEFKVHRPELNLETNTLYNSLPKNENTVFDYEKVAFENRSSLKSFTATISAKEERRRNIDADYLPQISANAAYTYQKIEGSTFQPEQQYNATLNLNWNVFSGLQTNALSQEATMNVLQARAESMQEKLRIKLQVDQSFIYVLKNRDSVKLTENLSIAAKEKFNQAQQRYEQGLSDFIELQEARQGYITALSNLVISYYDYFISISTLQHATGENISILQ